VSGGVNPRRPPGATGDQRSGGGGTWPTTQRAGGFQSGNDGGLFGNPDTTGSKNDYAGWNWHQIEAAIDGGSMMTTDDQRARAKGIADPNTLWTAGTTFYSVQTTLQMVGDAMLAQAKLLAGKDDSPWKGAAADAFMTMNDHVSRATSPTTRTSCPAGPPANTRYRTS